MFGGREIINEKLHAAQPFEEATMDNCVSMAVIQDAGKYIRKDTDEACEINLLKNPCNHSDNDLMLSVKED